MSDMPAYPSSSVAAAPVEPLGARPGIVSAAFWLYIAGIVVGLIAAAIAVPTLQTAAAKAHDQLSSSGHTISTSALTGAAVGVVIVLAVISAAVWALFVVFLRRDRGWARWVLGAFSLIALFGVAGGYGLGALRAALVVVATVLVFLPSASAWFRAAAARRKTPQA